MTTEIAFIGDIHGNLDALRGIEMALEAHGIGHLVFLGDYINKGAHSADVLSRVFALADDGMATLLSGNHEQTLLRALDSGNLAPFLKIGGAATIRSYIQGPVGPDVLNDFRAVLPRHDVERMRGMREVYETRSVYATHSPRRASDDRFRISAHVNVGLVPRIDHSSAQIDTGCGDPSGRLTAFLWPSREYVQVEPGGEVVR